MMRFAPPQAVVALVAVLSVATPFVTNAQPQESDSPLVDPASGTTCPLGRVAMVRGSDSEAREGGGFEAARANGIHGAVDLNGHLGEPILAVANGTVVVAARSAWGKLGKTVILDQDGGHTIYGHLHTVEVNREQPRHRGSVDRHDGLFRKRQGAPRQASAAAPTLRLRSEIRAVREDQGL
jgi:murein DD-endopeptidase MepM/ murein hydrolase activator NlpD